MARTSRSAAALKGMSIFRVTYTAQTTSTRRVDGRRVRVPTGKIVQRDVKLTAQDEAGAQAQLLADTQHVEQVLDVERLGRACTLNRLGDCYRVDVDGECVGWLRPALERTTSFYGRPRAYHGPWTAYLLPDRGGRKDVGTADTREAAAWLLGGAQ